MKELHFCSINILSLKCLYKNVLCYVIYIFKHVVVLLLLFILPSTVLDYFEVLVICIT